MPRKTKSATLKQHHAHIKRLHKQRLIWFIVLAAGLLLIQIVFQIQQANVPHKVKAYATNISIGDLASLTNQQRANNGKSTLQLNGKLNNGAQAKANDMLAKNYWAHVSPNGTQPWAFFTGAGYNYSSAGENLAYGFDSSAATIDGWMNSSGHRANLLGPYQDMGFGIASGPYQGGEYTIVVAFYGTPSSSSTPAPSTPKKQVATTPSPAPQPAPPAPAPIPEPTPITPPPELPSDASTLPDAPASEPAKVNTFTTLLRGNATWATVASVSLVGASSIGFAATHRELVRRSWKLSKHYVLVHPLIDAAVVATILAAILSATAGFIK